MSEYWFKRKRYGWGWVPVTWQGVAVTLLYILVVIAGTLMMAGAPEDRFSRELGVFFLVFILATAGFIRIALRHSPKPKWRWGRSKDDDPKKDF